MEKKTEVLNASFSPALKDQLLETAHVEDVTWKSLSSSIKIFWLRVASENLYT